MQAFLYLKFQTNRSKLLFIVCNHIQHDTLETLTIAKQSNVPNKQTLFVTFSSYIEKTSEFFKTPLDVDDFNKKFFRTTSFEQKESKY